MNSQSLEREWRLQSHCLLMLQVCTEGKIPFVLLAVIRHRNASPPADYIFNQLQPQVKKALSTASQDTSRDDSPLQSAFVRLCASFKKLSAYAESIFAYTETVAALLDLKTMQLHTVSFGEGSMAPYVVRSDGLEIEPEQRRSHYCDNHTVADCTYEGFSGQSFVLIGSSGLWCALSASELVQLSWQACSLWGLVTSECCSVIVHAH